MWLVLRRFGSGKWRLLATKDHFELSDFHFIGFQTTQFTTVVDANHSLELIQEEFDVFKMKFESVLVLQSLFCISWQAEPSMDSQSVLKSKPTFSTFLSKKVHCPLLPANKTMFFGTFTKKSSIWAISHVWNLLSSKVRYVKFCYWNSLSGGKMDFFKMQIFFKFPLKRPKPSWYQWLAPFKLLFLQFWGHSVILGFFQ